MYPELNKRPSIVKDEINVPESGWRAHSFPKWAVVRSSRSQGGFHDILLDSEFTQP